MKLSYVRNTLSLLSVIAFVQLAIGQAPNSGATNIPDHVTLTWAADPATTMTVTWRTAMTVTSGVVQFQVGGRLSKEARQVKADVNIFAADIGESKLWSATLVNLKPRQKYSYRVGDGEHWSEMLSFSTADPKTPAFKFLLFGDSQSTLPGDPPYNLWRNTLHNAYNANPDAKFIVNMGDLVDWGQQGAHWNAWFAAARGIIDRIPEMPVSGNHESFGSRDTSKPQYWVWQFTLPQNGPEGLKEQAYSYNYGPVHFVVLDSQQEEQKKYGDILKVQQAWLEADLAASKAEWKIVFFHRPPYGNMAKRTNDDIKAAFCPILEKYHVDLVFNAHDHAVARTHPINGIIYYVSGRSGGKTYPNLKKMEWNAFFYDPQDQPMYFVVEVKDKRIIVTAIKQDGTVIDTLPLDRKKSKLQTPRPEKKKAA